MIRRRLLHTLGILVPLYWLGSCSHAPYEEHSSYHQLYSPAMGRIMHYSVYTPPGWTSQEPLPLVLLLHGARDDHKSFDKFGVGATIKPLMQNGSVPRALIVNPEGELGFWENWHDGTRHYRDWVLNDLMSHIQKSYKTLPCPEHCHLTGVSMGAHGAMRFAYYQPERFSSVAAISTAIISKLHPPKNSWRMSIMKWLIPIKRIWGDVDAVKTMTPKDLDPYVGWVKKPKLQDVRLFLSWGDQDYKSIQSSNQHFHEHLVKHNRPHRSQVYVGEHKWVDWRNIIAESLRFHINKNTQTDMML